ncbi:methyltransferase-like protein [Leptotrombidium deliense]|uniref:Acetylserotonin O-methyltransferase n=1 Tax=Leptotrombidium deliense TaxID=299467 RepID=A0A443RYR8_9ACAR|nr:methyltransferase-like protein [Leptotrombidium deliense]
MNEEVKEMLDIIFSAHRTYVLMCADKLDIIEHLYEIPMDSQQLALVTNTKPDLLRRFLRVLCSLKILEENTNGQFTVTKLGTTLKSGTPNCLKNYFNLVNGFHPEPMMLLDHTLRTGEIAFDKIYKMPFFEYIRLDNEHSKTFDDAIKEQDRAFKSDTFVSNYDYSGFNHIVDVGGGNGSFVLSILNKTPNARGTVFDVEGCMQLAKREIKRSGLESRCTAVAGNFFDSVPANGDCYILQNILHDWEDSKALKILANIRKIMKCDTKIIIIEDMVRDNGEYGMSGMFDMILMTYFGAKTRTKKEMEELCTKAMLKMHECLEFKDVGFIMMVFTLV